MLRRRDLCIVATAVASLAIAILALTSAPIVAQGGDGGALPDATTPAAAGNGEPAPADAGAVPAARHPGLDHFQANCASCHSVGEGARIGPDLLGVLGRVPSRQWAVDYIRDPVGMGARDDYAKSLRAKSAVNMSPFGHLPQQVIDDILDFIAAGGPGLATAKGREATAEDIALGRLFFTGERRFASGAPACISCHDVTGLSGLGGGTLAAWVGAGNLDLTGAVVRAGGEQGLRAALATPQFPVMNHLFARTPLNEDEVIAVSAYLAAVGRGPADGSSSMAGSFAIWGVLGAVLLLLLLDTIWSRRFRNVRKSLVGERQ